MQKRSEETRAKILSEASRLFSEGGYDATGVAQICAAAGISKGAFYHHFQTKQAVFLALLNEWLVGLDQEVHRLLGQSKSVEQGFVSAVSVSQEVFESAQGQFPIFLEFWRESMHDPAVWNATIEPYRRYTHLFAGFIQRGIEEGSLQPVNPETAARALVALALGYFLQGMMDPQGAAWNDVMRDGMQLMMKGLIRRDV